jgi:hypothetical protein
VPPQGGRKHPHQEFIQIDTTNVLFIVAGAFAGLEDIISSRVGARRRLRRAAAGEGQGLDLFSEVEPEDLHKFGLIPEFIGRLPVVTSVAPLDQEALIEILTGPKNAFVKQYQRMFQLDGAELEFEDDALMAIADLAVARKTGARGLRRSSRTCSGRSCSRSLRSTTSPRSSSRGHRSPTARHHARAGAQAQERLTRTGSPLRRRRLRPDATMLPANATVLVEGSTTYEWTLRRKTSSTTRRSGAGSTEIDPRSCSRRDR